MILMYCGDLGASTKRNNEGFAKLVMLESYYSFTDKYIDRSDFALLEMASDSRYLLFQEIILKSFAPLV